MPLFSNFAAGAARGFGHGAKRVGGVLNTVVLPANNSNWVCPAGVTSVTIEGKGADGTTGWKSWSANVNAQADLYSTFPNPPYLQWSTIKAAADNLAAFLNSGGTGDRTKTFDDHQVWYVGANDSWETYPGSSAIRINGTATVETMSSPPATGNVTKTQIEAIGGYPGASVGYYVSYQMWDTTNGGSSTGLGKTFPGGVGGAASITTFNNVAVTPGNSYPMVNRGSLTIKYYA